MNNMDSVSGEIRFLSYAIGVSALGLLNENVCTISFNLSINNHLLVRFMLSKVTFLEKDCIEEVMADFINFLYDFKNDYTVSHDIFLIGDAELLDFLVFAKKV
jgi:hypothetical protein